MAKFHTILHPTDFSPGSAAAFERACDLARDYDARLIVLHAFGPVLPIGTDGIIVSANLDDLRAMAQKELDTLRPANPAIRLERMIREGPSASTILDTANEVKADLIVMGTHGRTGFRRLLLGSITEEVLRSASCPVLTVKAPAHAAERSEKHKALELTAGAGI